MSTTHTKQVWKYIKRLGITVAVLLVGLITYILWFILYHFIPISRIASNVEITQQTKDLYIAGLEWGENFCDIAWDISLPFRSYWLRYLYTETYERDKQIWHLRSILVNIYWYLFLSKQEECLYTLQRYDQNTFSYVTKVRDYNGNYKLMRLGPRGNELNVRKFLLKYQ